LQRGNIIVDFFTAKASTATRNGLDRLGALLLGLVMALMTWRTGVGALKAWESNSASMMMGLPEWTVYVCMVPALALTAVIALGSGGAWLPPCGGACMSPIQLTLLILLVMVALMALRAPIAVAMFAAGAVGYVTRPAGCRWPTSSTPRPSRGLPATT
jgi:hypothetical protein